MRRRLWFIILFLIAGVVLNLGVTWILAVWSAPAAGPSATTMPDAVTWPRSVPETWPAPASHGSTRSHATSTVITSAWIDPLVATREGRPALYGQSLLQYGFPLRALEAEFRMTIDEPYRRVNRQLAMLGPVPDWLAPRNPHRIVPLRPVWPGFLVNSFFFGAVALCAVALTAWARQQHRRRRGRCAQCGYPTGASPQCSECGAALGRAMGRPRAA